MEGRAKRSTVTALRALTALRPETARIPREGGDVELPIGALRRGDLFVVRPGERIPPTAYSSRAAAAAAMALSSVSVVANALLLRRWSASG